MFEDSEQVRSESERRRTFLFIGSGVLLFVILLLLGVNEMSDHEAKAQAEEQKRRAAAQRMKDIDDFYAAQAELKQQREQQMNDQPAVYGVETSFEQFFADVRTTGVPASKRFRFRATPSNASGIEELCRSGRPGGTSCLPAVADFDDSDQLRAVIGRLVQKYDTTCTVVVSVPGDGEIHIHRATGCD